ncbi:hypothetical protein GCM10010399_77710 [Dactylosporangium fulvum]
MVIARTVSSRAVTPACDARSSRVRYRRYMGGNAVFVWIMLGLAAVVLILIALYVDSWRRKDDA